MKNKEIIRKSNGNFISYEYEALKPRIKEETPPPEYITKAELKSSIDSLLDPLLEKTNYVLGEIRKEIDEILNKIASPKQDSITDVEIKFYNDKTGKIE